MHKDKIIAHIICHLGKLNNQATNFSHVWSRASVKQVSYKLWLAHSSIIFDFDYNYYMWCGISESLTRKVWWSWTFPDLLAPKKSCSVIAGINPAHKSLQILCHCSHQRSFSTVLQSTCHHKFLHSRNCFLWEFDWTAWDEQLRISCL